MDNCTATCVEGDSEPQCGVAAGDADEDGHGSALCAAEPGDDCDDTHDTVYEGAPELCDRLDNDCDLLTDLLDGLTIPDTLQELGDPTSDQRFAADVAWLEEQALFGVVWRDDKPDNGPSVMFMGVKPDGTIQIPAKPIQGGYPMADAGLSALQYRPRIAAGHGGFGVTWTNAAGIGFREIPSTGVLSSAAKLIATSAAFPRPDVAFSEAAMNWAIVWTNEAATITANGTASAAKAFTQDALTFPRIAALGNGFVVVGNFGVVLASGDLTEPTELPLKGVEPTWPAVAAGESRFGVVTTPGTNAPAGSQPAFTAYDAQGNTLCGPVDVGAAGLLVTDVVAIATGYIINFDYRYGVQEIGLDCSLGQLLVNDTGVDTNYRSSFDGSDTSGYLITAVNPDTEILEYQRLGVNFCN